MVKGVNMVKGQNMVKGHYGAIVLLSTFNPPLCYV